MKTIILIISLFAAVQSCGELVSPNIRPDEIHPNERYYVEGCIGFEITRNHPNYTRIPYSMTIVHADGKKEELGGELKNLQKIAAIRAGECGE
jgi:hypothetical protein